MKPTRTINNIRFTEPVTDRVGKVCCVLTACLVAGLLIGMAVMLIGGRP